MTGLTQIYAEEYEWSRQELWNNLNGRLYYDEAGDLIEKERYYEDISLTSFYTPAQLRTLLEKTHHTLLGYAPHRYLYPWVDLQEDGSLTSLYSGRKMEPLEAIEQDIRTMERAGAAGSGEKLQLNCEHAVPQSWFHKQNPMRGDLHHLFACEPGCNNMRSNYPYDDFPDYTPDVLKIKNGCGKAENGKFEPEYGKGTAARAVLYFIIRYPNVISHEMVNVPLLLEWHSHHPVKLYEKHRNQAVQELQGNRNPFIDFPEYAEAFL